ncbi:CLUMA_CG007964, isoform A [Clunio marinus]|uniref:CLUMA_CG007964, isoform A n=1 Tax=Clunio marinus TaxID=568069 RepID=A0A1J1I7T2_9DIPT|nr:CLUMA_CG007964, isoform A [Clunio marinus]
MCDDTSWSNCHVDIWFVISRYLSPEDTLNFALICKKTFFVTNSETYWNGLFDRFIRSKYKWLDKPTTSNGSCIRDETIRELFKMYPKFMNRKRDPDSYDKAVGKICISIKHSLNEKFMDQSYVFKVKSKSKAISKLAQLNRDEGCQLLVIRSKQFVPFPYESDNLTVKYVSKNLSRGFRAYKLKIQFCDHFGNSAGETLVFDPIISVQLYDWWEPEYKAYITSGSY